MALLNDFIKIEDAVGVTKGGFKVKKGDRWCFMAVHEVLDDNYMRSHTLKRGEWICCEYYDHLWGFWGYHEETDGDTPLKLRRRSKVDSADGIIAHIDAIKAIRKNINEIIEEENKQGEEYPITKETLFEGNCFQDYIPRDLEAYWDLSTGRGEANWELYIAVDSKLKKIIAFAFIPECLDSFINDL